MERPFDDAAMLHFIRDSLFRSDSPLHHEFFIAERIASRESEWFPCLSRDLHSCLQKLADTQAKVIELEQRIDVLQATAASATAATQQRVDVLQATAASATAATGQRIDTLQSSTENATQAAANELRRVEHELSQCYALLNEFVRTFESTTSEQHPVSATTTTTVSATTVLFEFEPTSPSTTTSPTAAYLRTTTPVRSSTCSFAGGFGTPRRAPEQTGQEVHG